MFAFLALHINISLVIVKRKTRALHWLNLGAFCFFLVLTSGCIRSKAFWQRTMKESGTITIGGEYHSQGLKPPLVLTADQITNSVVGTETNRSTRVSSGADLQPHAKLVARFFAQALTETEHFLDASLPAPHVYLLRLPGERRTIQFSMTLPEANQTMPWLMLLTNAPSPTLTPPAPDSETLWADLQGLPFQIFLLTHEACEMHLIKPSNFLVMGDVTGQKGFFKFTLEHHTRWFRDGLANFCALKRSQSFRRQLLEAGIKPEAMRFAENSMQPFSELARAKDKLFGWDQDSKADYYEAATALFLLIEQRAGPEAISAIVRALPNIKFPDGNALLRMITQKTGLDLRLIARTFEFPDLGLETQLNSIGQIEIANVAPNSWAARAKLLKGDVVLEANSRMITGLLDFEMEILKTLDAHQTLSLTFLRNGTRHITEVRLSI